MAISEPNLAWNEDREEGSPEQRFGRRVRELRERGEMTQAGLAQILKLRGLKLDPSAIARLEKGLRSIRLDEAVVLGETFGVTVDEMLRPAMSVEEQLKFVEEYARRTELRALYAVAEHDGAAHRLERLRQRLDDSGGDDGQHQEAP